MKKIYRIIAIIIILALLSTSVGAAEQEEASTYSSAFFTSTVTYLYDISGNTFGVWFDALAKYKMDELGACTIKIQRSSDGSSWSTVRTYESDDYYSIMIGTDTITHANGLAYIGNYGYYYRAKVTYYAKSGSSTGKYTTYTATKKL